MGRIGEVSGAAAPGIVRGSAGRDERPARPATGGEPAPAESPASAGDQLALSPAALRAPRERGGGEGRREGDGAEGSAAAESAPAGAGIDASGLGARLRAAMLHDPAAAARSHDLLSMPRLVELLQS